MVPLDWDPSSNVLIAVAAPNGINGGALFSYPALVQGDVGPAATLDTVVNFTGLAYNDSTPDSASMTDLGGGLYQLNLTLHDGSPGPEAPMVLLTATDLVGTPLAGQMIVANSHSPVDGFVYATPPVGDSTQPATIADTPSGNPTFTLATASLGPYTFDWRPEVSGYCVVTGTGTNVITDLVARLGSAGGNDVGRCAGVTSTERLTLSAGPPPGSNDAWDKVLAGNVGQVFFRVERQSGSDTATTSHTTSRFWLKANPVP
jgi:hypothetical protein